MRTFEDNTRRNVTRIGIVLLALAFHGHAHSHEPTAAQVARHDHKVTHCIHTTHLTHLLQGPTSPGKHVDAIHSRASEHAKGMRHDAHVVPCRHANALLIYAVTLPIHLRMSHVPLHDAVQPERIHEMTAHYAHANVGSSQHVEAGAQGRPVVIGVTTTIHHGHHAQHGA